MNIHRSLVRSLALLRSHRSDLIDRYEAMHGCVSETTRWRNLDLIGEITKANKCYHKRCVAV